MNKSRKHQTEKNKSNKSNISKAECTPTAGRNPINISKADRTLTALSRLDGRVYVYCSDRRTLQRFIEDAENEYFHYRDGVSLLERKPDSIMALNRDRTVNYIGYAGTLAFRTASMVGDQPLIRVDYRKYVAGEEDFIYRVGK